MSRVTKTIEVFTITVPAISKDEPQKVFHFTTHSSPVTVDGQQYVPVSVFDQEKWLRMYP